MVIQHVTKVHKQHSSMVTSVPIPVQVWLELTKESHIVWQVDTESNFVQVGRVVAGGKSHGRGSGNSDSKD